MLLLRFIHQVLDDTPAMEPRPGNYGRRELCRPAPEPACHVEAVGKGHVAPQRHSALVVALPSAPASLHVWPLVPPGMAEDQCWLRCGGTWWLLEAPDGCFELVPSGTSRSPALPGRCG